MERNKFIEEILNSSTNIKVVSPNDDLFHRIQHKIKSENNSQKHSRWLIAASVAILISINTSMLISKANINKNELSALVEISDNQIY